MSSLARSERYTLEEYFALERASQRRFEYRDGEIVCMSGGSIEHAAIASNIVAHLAARLRGACKVFGSDLAVYVPDGNPYRYPDVSVVCGEVCLRQVDGRDCLENPVLLAEVLSPTSADYDLGTKFEQYKSIPSFSEYLLVAQDRPYIVRRVRGVNDHDTWHETAFNALDASVHLESVRITLDLRNVYEGMSFE